MTGGYSRIQLLKTGLSVNGRRLIMVTRRLLQLSILIAAIIATFSTYCFAQGPALGSSQLHQENTSGISARFYFFDDGNQLVVVGIASGLDPAGDYCTLLYGNGALPGGPNGCAGTTVTSVGDWNVNGDGIGTISASFSGFGLEDFGANSIQLNSCAAPPGALQACGHIRVFGY
jgi:hypothetical protein